MVQLNQVSDRRTTIDEIFDFLYEEITSLRMRPGDKISEAEVASRFNVSRQPVRDAFSRLENLDLLLIRPQRATEVKRFSEREIEKSRFVRAAVEAAVLRKATACCNAKGAALLHDSLDRQCEVVEAGNLEAFGQLDYEFHKTLCEIAQVAFAFEVISAEKAKLDRLCNLALAKEHRMVQLLKDHQAIAQAVIDGDAEGAHAAGMLHLTRLDSTIEAISASNANYFDPD